MWCVAVGKANEMMWEYVAQAGYKEKSGASRD